MNIIRHSLSPFPAAVAQLGLGHMSNPAAQAWIEASQDLGIRYIHPFTFTTQDGRQLTTTGGLLPDFGGPHGTLLLTRFDSEAMDGSEDDTDFYSSGLNPESYEPYRREVYIETLNDWGWFGAEAPPTWFTGHIYSHGNVAMRCSEPGGASRFAIHASRAPGR